MICFRGLTVTLFEQYRFVLIGRSIEITMVQDFMLLYRARAGTLFTSAFDRYLVFTYTEFVPTAICYTVTNTHYY